jgi:hypothetical protein
MNKQLKTIPKFTVEAEERKFWETQDSSDYLNWNIAQSILLPNLKPTYLEYLINEKTN